GPERAGVGGEVVGLETEVDEAATLLQSLEPAVLRVRLEERDQLEVRAVREGDERVVGADRVPSAGHHCEVEPAIARDGGVQLGHDDDEMIDTLQHQARFFLKKAIVRSHASFAAASL